MLECQKDRTIKEEQAEKRRVFLKAELLSSSAWVRFSSIVWRILGIRSFVGSGRIDVSGIECIST